EATIPITSQKELRVDVPTTIDGQGQITLDANGATRFFHFVGYNYRWNPTALTLQNLRLINGAATGDETPRNPNGSSACNSSSWLDCSGGAVYIQDGVLHVFNTTFENNHADLFESDVGGGAIYGFGALEMIIVDSRFVNNTAGNGGAIGALNADLSVYNSSFERSVAFADGGAILIDGGFA